MSACPVAIAGAAYLDRVVYLLIIALHEIISASRPAVNPHSPSHQLPHSLSLSFSLSGTASVARGYSAYLDASFNQSISGYFESLVHWDIPHMSKYPDFLAFGLTIFVTSEYPLSRTGSSPTISGSVMWNLMILSEIIMNRGPNEMYQ